MYDPTKNWNASAFLRTSTGKVFYPDRVEELEVDIVDIANQLSKVCRYNGCLNEFYSVAQHSYIVCDYAWMVFASVSYNPLTQRTIQEFKLQALLHDATEAYLPDMPSPVKQFLPDFKGLEKKLQRHIFKSFGLNENEHSIIKQVDTDIRIAEIRSMSLWPEGDMEDKYPYLHIEPWPWRKARDKFLERYHEICASS